MQFYDLAYPATGPFITLWFPPGVVNAKGEQATFHKQFQQRDDAIAFIKQLDANGVNAYLAQASFDGTCTDKGRPIRKQEHAVMLKSFFLDIDVQKKGNTPSYDTRNEAFIALKTFCDQIEMPYPTIVSSGYGIYAYWFLVNEIPAPQWQQIATVLGSLSKHLGYKFDPARIRDSSSVLRVPGCHNHKPEVDPKPVEVVTDLREPMLLGEFTKVLNRACKTHGVDSERTFSRPKVDHGPANDLVDFMDMNHRLSSAHTIANKCNQIRRFRDLKGDVSEPEWYSALCLLRFTVEAPEILHEWSSGHPDYTPAATEAKVQQPIEKNIGPTTCRKFSELNAEGCIGCPHKDRTNSPITLGHIMPEKIELSPDETEPPAGYDRTVNGLYGTTGDGEIVHFYRHDLYVSRLAFDQSLNQNTMTIRHHLPHDGWQEFTIRAGLFTDSKSCLMALADNGVIVGGGAREKKFMVGYLEGYQQRIQENRRTIKLFNQMGWKDDPLAFVLGQKIFFPDGRVDEAPLGRCLPPAAQAYKESGELAPWVKATEVFGLPGMEGLAFAFLAGAFGAPLMRFTGFEGGMISLVGPSGVGKSLVSRFIQSTYGDPSPLMMLRDDTKNSLISRIGVYGSLPMTIDEVTNMTPEECSDLAYRVTQGRDKARLHRSGVERATINHWNTIAVVSSNHSLISKLSNAKADASAEMNRVFEYFVNHAPDFGRATATGVYRAITENFGLAGPIYAKHIVTTTEQHRRNLDAIIKMLESKAKILPEERYWVSLAATAILGGAYAKQLGLIQFDISGVIEWAAATIVENREAKGGYISDSVTLIGQYFNQHASNGLILLKTPASPRSKDINPVLTPRGPLYHRIEQDTGRATISREALKMFLSKVHGDITKVLKDLTAVGAVVHSNQRKILGANTDYAGALIPCVVLDMTNPALGNVVLKLVPAKGEEWEAENG